MDEKLINFLLVLMTGRVWRTDDDIEYYNVDLWDCPAWKRIIQLYFLDKLFAFPIIEKKNGLYK